jgi:hypothetical protein
MRFPSRVIRLQQPYQHRGVARGLDSTEVWIAAQWPTTCYDRDRRVVGKGEVQMKLHTTLILGCALLLGTTPVCTDAAQAAEQAQSESEKPAKAKKVRKPARKRSPARSAYPSPTLVPGADPRTSQRAVCQSQCNLERMSCDQGRAGAFQNRADQLQAAQSSCYLAVNACLSRC